MSRKIIGVTVGTPINPNKFAPKDALRIDKTATDEKGLLIGQKGSALAEVITLGEGLKIEDGKLELNIPVYNGEMGVVDLIKFFMTVHTVGEEYIAAEGMTWGEWIESEYNTGGYLVNEDNVVCGDCGELINDGSDAVKATDIIIADKTYSYFGG